MSSLFWDFLIVPKNYTKFIITIYLERKFQNLFISTLTDGIKNREPVTLINDPNMYHKVVW